MKRPRLFFVVFLALLGGVFGFECVGAAAAPAIVWEKNFGGSGDDWANSVRQTSDGGYILVGGTQSSKTGDVKGKNKGIDGRPQISLLL